MAFDAQPPSALTSCARCQLSIHPGQETVDCPECGRWYHARCWQAAAGCTATDCPAYAGPPPDPDDDLFITYEPAAASQETSPSANEPPSDGTEPILTISPDDLDRAVPQKVIVPRRERRSRDTGGMRSPPDNRRTNNASTEAKPLNRLAVASFLTGLGGTVCFGIVTGLVAIVLGLLAVGQLRSRRQRGLGFAATGMLLGVFDIVLWGAAIVAWMGTGFSGEPSSAEDDLDIDLAALEQLDPPLKRAMLANVLIRVKNGGLLGGGGMGSGVILKLDRQTAWVLTNRHVIDPDFSDRTDSAALPDALQGSIEVKLVGQPLQPGRVVWTAPDGIDLALVQTTVTGGGNPSVQPQSARWETDIEPRIGDEVFAVGNPQGLGWTHTQGTVSQFRTQPKGSRQVRLVQTSTAINPGNSGGGLYDAEGRLIGINTATIDKRVADGLSFAIAIRTFLTFDVPFVRSAPPGAPAVP